ncbi:hypothetical protein WJX72_010715 [[Myrmecia] bisecta]|uniref:Uncharacterized protein n=1 Tax=[Myrmecia] bisecta TaxID=41462 RepID=A0AAW1QSD1_9CHLO
MVICNSLYYTVSFLVLWLGVLHMPKGLGLAGAGRRFLEVFGVMYVGSQASKLPRAAGMLMLAPLVGRVMEALQTALHLQSSQAVFNVILAVCSTAAFGTYGCIILAWA